jgi:diguanylate cyclase (GGDEF)-like protein
MSETESRIDGLNRQAWDRMLAAPEEALATARSALAEAEAANYRPGIAEARLNIGWCENFLTRHAEAIESLQAALDGFTSLEDNTGVMKALNALGAVYHDMSRYERAMDYYTRSLEAARRHGNAVREAATLNNIGEVCLELGELKEALDYFLRSYETIPDDRDSELVSNVLLNIGTTFNRMENWPLARDFTEKALAIATAAGERIIESQCLHALGRIDQASDMPDRAEAHYLKAIAIDVELKNDKFRTAVLLDLGSLRVRSGELDGALANYREALSIAEGIGTKALIHAAYERLSEINERLGDYQAALVYYRSFARYEHEVMSEDASRKIKNITVQYEVDKSRQEAEIYRLKNIELKEKTEALEEANRQLLAISETGKRLTASLDLDTVITTLYEVLKGLIPFGLFGLALYDEAEGSLDYRAYIVGGKRRHRPRVKLDPKRSFAAACIRRREPIFLSNVAAQAEDYIEGEPIHSGFQAGSLIFHPLVIDERVIGVITVQSDQTQVMTERHLALITSLSHYISIAVENSLIHDRLEEFNRSIIGEKEALEKEAVTITHLANHDPLTGLPNRRLLFELLQKTFDIASRNGTRVGVIYIDLDDFKPINDRLGHAAGDRALVAIAERIRSLLRASDTVARVGGDEFVAVLANVRDRDAIVLAARKIIEESDKPLPIGDAECRVQFSMGIAVYPDDGTTIEQLVSAADAAMYSVKRDKKHGFAFASRCGRLG